MSIETLNGASVKNIAIASPKTYLPKKYQLKRRPTDSMGGAVLEFGYPLVINGFTNSILTTLQEDEKQS